MPTIVRTTIGDIAMWVRQGPQAAWDIGTSQAVITGDEYGLQPFLNSPLRHKVRTVVDIGANIGAFTLAARRMFPNARVIAVEPDPENNELLRRNCGDDSQVTICPTAVLNDGCPSTVHLCRHELNSGGSYVRELFQQKSAPFTDTAPIKVPCRSIHDLLAEMSVNVIDLLKVDAEGSEVEIFSCLADPGGVVATDRIATCRRRAFSTGPDRAGHHPQSERKALSMKVVFTNGVFDLLHVGHIRLLHFARNQGDWLLVAINSDASVRRIKGSSRPIIPAEERAEMLFALRCVDDVQIFEDDTPEPLIRRLRPNVLVKGPACRDTEIPGAAFVESIGGRIVIPEWPVEHSSTQLVGRMIRAAGAVG